MSENYWYSSLSGEEIENRLIGGVLFNADQGLTTSQKARARANIGAGEGSTSFKILGFFATIDDLREYLQTLPGVGDAYGISINPTPTTELLSPDGTQRQFTLTETPWHIVVADGETVLVPQTDYIYANGVITFTTAPAAGTDTIRVLWYDETAPYNVFVWDGVTQTWIDNGPLLSSSLIDDNDTLTTKTWSSSKINTEVSTLSTEKQDKITASGILKGNGNGAVSAATKGVDYAALSFTINLLASGWSNGAQTISNANFLASGFAFTVSPNSAARSKYMESLIYADDVTVDGQMTFHCDTAPDTNLTVNILRVVSA